MEDGDESTLFLCMGEAFARHERDMSDARDAVFELLVEEVRKVAMRSQHYLTLQYLDKPCESAWMSLYMSGYDRNFLNTTSLTRTAFSQLLVRFSRFYRIPPPSCQGRPPKLQYHHQVLGLVMSFYVGSMENSTLSLLFGLPPATLARTLRSAEKALAATLQNYKRSSKFTPSRATRRSTATQTRKIECLEVVLAPTRLQGTKTARVTFKTPI
ncbi:hypothetical protein F443_02450 [Phytophthora nicotianae P1569]|uniref:DDE Tnp4 domain-containing protein n=1 Tax=Phytophthora nicotianae P1569 TaxID=1317065 RepID=V9FVL7_PHYNI|nr:hypothetical protein F443_02450 [Phytophthora nicotianae P1569]